MAFWSNPEEAIRLSGESSKTTHGNIECIDACRYFAGLLIGAIRGCPKAKLLSAGFEPVPGLWNVQPLAPKIAAIAAGSFARKQPPAIRGGGYVVDCLEAALWAFASTDDFKSAVLAAANLGDDADTTAAVCGQIAGAFYGLPAIPSLWLDKLAHREQIIHLAQSLAEMGASDRSV
jgi:ADP-ribosylglycohydrolase